MLSSIATRASRSAFCGSWRGERNACVAVPPPGARGENAPGNRARVHGSRAPGFFGATRGFSQRRSHDIGVGLRNCRRHRSRWRVRKGRSPYLVENDAVTRRAKRMAPRQRVGVIAIDKGSIDGRGAPRSANGVNIWASWQSSAPCARPAAVSLVGGRGHAAGHAPGHVPAFFTKGPGATSSHQGRHST